MTSIYTDPDFEFDTTSGYMTGATATFQYETTFVRRDPECGDFRDYHEVTGLELVNVAFGGLILTRDQMQQADKSALEAIEADYAQRVQEQLDAGELECAA